MCNRWRYGLLVAVVLIWIISAAVVAAQGDGHVDLIQAQGPVTPVMLSYIERGIAQAEKDGAVCLIVQLDTPGGSVSLTKSVVQRIVEARVPVVVYVAPRGAWAASAGTLITLAGHVAVMAPETSIGAASPVGMQGEELPETVQKKEKEILMASARALVARRGEKAVAWVERAIDQAEAATAQEALEAAVIVWFAVPACLALTGIAPPPHRWWQAALRQAELPFDAAALHARALTGETLAERTTAAVELGRLTLDALDQASEVLK